MVNKLTSGLKRALITGTPTKIAAWSVSMLLGDTSLFDAMTSLTTVLDDEMTYVTCFPNVLISCDVWIFKSPESSIVISLRDGGSVTVCY